MKMTSKRGRRLPSPQQYYRYEAARQQRRRRRRHHQRASELSSALDCRNGIKFGCDVRFREQEKEWGAGSAGSNGQKELSRPRQWHTYNTLLPPLLAVLLLVVVPFLVAGSLRILLATSIYGKVVTSTQQVHYDFKCISSYTIKDIMYILLLLTYFYYTYRCNTARDGCLTPIDG